MNHCFSYDRVSFTPTVDIRDGEILLYGRMEKPQNIPPDQRIGARIGIKDRCANCGGPFIAGEHVTADLAPNMAGVAYHTDCVNPTNPDDHND